MSSVSNIEQQNQVLAIPATACRAKPSTLEGQISTGQKSTNFAGLAPQAAQVVDLTAT